MMKRTLNELLLILPCVDNFNEWAESLPCPTMVGPYLCPNLDGMTLGQYMALAHIEAENLLFEAVRIMLPYKLPDEVIGGFDASEVVGFVWHLSKTVNQLNGLFESLNPELSNEEKAAGPPNIGVMGLIDFASTRFGKTYSEAEKLNVWEVYEAMRIATETAEYKKRLQTIYTQRK